LVPKILQFFEVARIANDYIELLLVELFFGKNRFARICLLYRSPSPPKKLSSASLLSTLFDILPGSDLPTFLVGDFNYPDIHWPVQPIGQVDLTFYLGMLEMGFHQAIRAPTHEAGNILDLFFVSNMDFLTDIKVCGNFSNSDHYEIRAILGPFKVSRKNEKITFYNYKKADFDAMSRFLLQYDWPSLLNNCADTEAMWLCFEAVMKCCITRFVPVCSYQSRKYVWSRDTAKLHRRQSNLHRKWKEDPTTVNRLAWRDAARLARKAKRYDMYLAEKKLLDSRDDTRFYSFVKSRFSPHSDIPVLEYKGQKISGAGEKAEAFNDYFSSVFTVDDGNPLPYVVMCDDTISDVLFSPEVVTEHLENLSAKFSSGIDLIPQMLLFNLRTAIAQPL
jgi:hypothetical protein